MSHSIPATEKRLKALYGFRCEDLYEVHEAMRDILNRARDAEALCRVRVSEDPWGSFCMLPEHNSLLCAIIDELGQFLGEREEEVAI